MRTKLLRAPRNPRSRSGRAARLFPLLLGILGAGLGSCTGPNDTANPDGGGGGCGGGCPPDRVCQSDACVPLPATCPCPKESYCELPANMCRVGCLDDSGCNTGRVCQSGTRTCVVGCREDKQCDTGQLCDLTSTPGVCRSGCRTDGSCAAGSFCDVAQSTCRKGLRLDLTPKQAVTTITGGPYVRIGDIDGDSKLDLLVGGGGSTDLAIFLGNGDGSFTAKGKLTPAGAFSDPLLADVDGDKRADLVTVGSRGVDVYLGQADGSLRATAVRALGMNTGASSMVIDDFNRDGKMDVAVGYATTGVVTVMQSVSSANPTSRDLLFCTGGTARLHGGDLNGDGRTDLGGHCVTNSSDYLALISNGDGTFASAARQGTTLLPDSYDALRDLNGDGKADLLSYSGPNNQVLLALNLGGGKFADRVTLTSGRGPLAVAVADLNRDGAVDIISANTSSSDASVFLGRGDGTFLEQRVFALQGAPRRVLSGDFDGDGKPDLIFPVDMVGVTLLLNRSR